MGFMFDYHMHTQYSGDIPAGKGSTVAELCEAAITRGFQEIAITDHCDIDGIYYGAFPKLDIEGVYRDIQAAREQFNSKLNILFGIEIGQACHMPKESKFLIDRFQFDYVIGSVHAVRGILDFSDLKINELDDSRLIMLWEQYISEMKELLDWGCFCTLAHITYPYRYYKFACREHLLDLENKGREVFEDILKTVIEKGISLEVNTSGLRQGLGQTLPNTDLIKFYKELGGEMITLGSDAHNARDVGADVRETAELLKSLGFKYITRYKDRKPYMQKID